MQMARVLSKATAAVSGPFVIFIIGIGFIAMLCVDCGDNRPPEEGRTAGPSVRGLLTGLRGKSEGQFFDFHGNACPQLEEVIAARFHATEAILNELDAKQSNSGYVHALLFALGFIKDPASIAWLDLQMKNPEMANFVYRSWMPRWETRLSAATHSQLNWLEGKALWREFFIKRFRLETNDIRRLILLRIITSWFHDAETKEFLVEICSSANLLPSESVLAQMYLSQHGQAIDINRLREAIHLLTAARQDKFLLEVSREFRHEAFVPYLISALETQPGTTSGDQQFDPEELLRRITLALDISGVANWQAWYRRHQSEKRTAWIERAVNELLQLLERDEGTAVQSFGRAIYFWDDPSFLTYMKKFVRFKSLANSMIGWINLSYRSYARDKFYNLAVLILQTQASELTSRSKEILRQLDFLEGQRESWMQYVVRMNSSV